MVNVLKFRTPKKKEHTKFIFSPHQWSKGNRFRKGRQFNYLPLQIGYFPHRIFDIFLFEIKILLHVRIFRTLTVSLAVTSQTRYATVQVKVMTNQIRYGPKSAPLSTP